MAEEFEATLDAGVAMEQRLDWEGALRLYESMLRRLDADASDDSSREARRAAVQLRRGNALMVLRRMDDARAAFDAGLYSAKASGEPLVVARALMAAGGFSGRSGDSPRAERFLAEAPARFLRLAAWEGRQSADWAHLKL